MAAHQELVARNVRRFRQERGLSMGELARRAGLAKQTLSSIEQAQGNPTVDTLALLAEALGVSLRRLLTEFGTPVFVQRRGDAGWDRHGPWRERLLSEVYGSGYVRTLLVRLERTQRRPEELDPHDPGTLHHLYVIAGRLRALLLAEFGLADSEDLDRAIIVAVEAGDAVLKLAFRHDPNGDPEIVAEAKQLVRGYLSRQLSAVSGHG